MLLLHKKKHGIDFYTVWFAKEPLKKNGIISYRECMTKEDVLPCTEFNTLLTDLRETEEDIKKHFSKNCRYYVNRASREDITVKMYSGKEISNEKIKEFLDFFEEFWVSKGSLLQEREKLEQELRGYRDADAFGITEAFVKGQKVVYHTHILDTDIVRLLHSASLYRLEEDDAEGKNLIGIANRYLHFEEMKYYKSLGKKIYDWGGAGMQEDVVHITEFKKSFGGTPITYYDFEQANGMLAKAFKLVVAILK